MYGHHLYIYTTTQYMYLHSLLEFTLLPILRMHFEVYIPERRKGVGGHVKFYHNKKGGAKNLYSLRIECTGFAVKWDVYLYCALLIFI